VFLSGSTRERMGNSGQERTTSVRSTRGQTQIPRRRDLEKGTFR
jgi:hypothetical protein